MAPRTRKKSSVSDAFPPHLSTVNLHAAGIDGGAEEHWAAVPACDASHPVRRFGANTADLDALADWLWACDITTVALESTGVSWIPLCELLAARGFQVLLVDPGKMPRNGRPKSDVHECQWMQRLHTDGLLSACCRPADQVVVLRSYWRQRAALLADAARDIQHLPKARTQMHVKLQHVVSDITGVTGLSIIKAILAGERDPQTWAQWRDHRCKQDAASIAQALYGTWRAEHLFALQQALERYEFHHRQIAACDGRIEIQLQRFADRSQGEPFPPQPGQRRRPRHRPAFDPRGPLHRMTGVDLTRIEGSDETTALIVISESGLDMRKWPSAKHCTSWLGVAPHQRVSGGTVLRSRTRPPTNRAAAAWRLAAASLPHSKSALGAYFRRMKSRVGPPKALTATAHKLARLIYSLLKHGTAYVTQGMDDDEQQSRDRAVKHVHRRAKEVGYALHPAPERTPA
jgi:transposase